MLDRINTDTDFDEVSGAFNWAAGGVVSMLWAYFDESGEHDQQTGHLRQLTVGGWISSRSEWEKLESEWKSALDRAGISAFHMTDFERYEREFQDWDEDKHKAVLNELLEIIAKHLTFGLGFTSRVQHPDLSKHFADTYENDLIQCLMFVAGKSGIGFSQKISLVFAKHNDYRLPRIKQILDDVNLGDHRLATLQVSDPIDVRGLQAADILAYELQHFNRDTSKGLSRRYPLRRLKELGCGLWISTPHAIPSHI
jgi:hypothetical protein